MEILCWIEAIHNFTTVWSVESVRVQQPEQAHWNVCRIACFIIIIIIIGTNCSFIFSFSVRVQNFIYLFFALSAERLHLLSDGMGWNGMVATTWPDLVLIPGIILVMCVSVSLSISVWVCRFVYISTNELFTLAINNKIQESTYRSRFSWYCLKSRCCRELLAGNWRAKEDFESQICVRFLQYAN